MRSAAQSLVCVLIPWLYTYLVFLNYLKSGLLSLFRSQLGQTCLFAIMTLVLMGMFLLAKGKLSYRYRNWVGVIAALQLPVAYVINLVCLKMAADPNQYSAFWGIFFFNGPHLIPFALSLLVISILDRNYSL
jgi:hypothetical protein